MKNGYGSPYVEVHTSLGKVVENVTEFTYNYSQEGDDTCQITLEAAGDDVTLPDKPEFQEGVILKVLWGYIGSEVSKSRTVVIRNTKAHYAENKISLDLLCTNRASLLKHTSSKKVRKGNVKDIADEITKDTGIQVTVVASGGQPTFTEGALGGGKNRLEEGLRVYPQLPQAGRSDYQLLEHAAENDPAGPLELIGRDNEIIIQRRNLNQKPIRSYTYGDTTGLLMNFTPESKNLSRQSSSMNTSVSGINPSNKTEFEGDVNNLNNPDAKLGAEVDTPPRYIKSDGNTALATGSSSKPVTKGSTIKPAGTTKVPNNAESKNRLPPPELQATVTSSLGQPTFTEGALGGGKNRLEEGKYPPIDYNKTEHSVEDDIADAIARAVHDQSMAALKKNPAELEVVGDPLLESGKVITILNVSTKYSGNYYIESCEHTIVFGQPYTCNMKLSKNATGNTGSTSPLKTPASEPINNQIGPDSIEPGTYQLEVPDNVNATAPIKLDTGE